MTEQRIVRQRWRRETSLYWTRANIIPAVGEPVYESDTGRFKLGNGMTPWNELPYFVPGAGISEPTPVATAELTDHINDASPHPVYDDGVSFSLLYNNAKV